MNKAKRRREGRPGGGDGLEQRGRQKCASQVPMTEESD